MKRIIIETNSNIGDAVMNVPIINFLHAKYPSAKFDLICDARSADIFCDFGCVENIYIKNKKDRLGFAKLLAKLFLTKYDLAIGLRSDAVPLLIRARKKLYKFDKNSDICGKVSETLCNFSILRKFFDDATEEKINTAIATSSKKVDFAKKLINFHHGERILAVAPGANSPGKVWQASNFIELIQSIKSKFDKVVIVGSALENGECEYIASKTASINLAGKTTLSEASALFSICSFFVGNDSGLGHIASAQGVKTFIIFAHTDISYADPIRYTPYKQYSIYRNSNDEALIEVENVIGRLETILS